MHFICLQEVHAEENGQQEAKRSSCEEFEEEESQLEQERIEVHEEQMDTSVPRALETQSLTQTSQDVETSTGIKFITVTLFY